MKLSPLVVYALCGTVVSTSTWASRGNTNEGLANRALTSDGGHGIVYIQLVSNKLVSTNRHLCLTFDPTEPRRAKLEHECDFQSDDQTWIYDNSGRIRSPNLPGYCLSVDKNHPKLLLGMAKCSNTRATQRWSYENRRFRSAFQRNKNWCMDHYRSYGNAVHLMPCSPEKDFDHDQLFDLVIYKDTPDQDPIGEYEYEYEYPDTAGPDKPCYDDGDCYKHHACAFIYGGGSRSSECCERGERSAFDAETYCTGRPNGKGCAAADMCSSGYCDDNGICQPALAAPGESCYDDNDCYNNKCALMYGRGSGSSVCCESGRTTMFDTEKYCAGRPNGKACATSDMCASGYCDDNGICRPALAAPGESCYDDNDCHNHNCALIYGGGSGSSVCCESGTTVFDAEKYCARRPNGKACATSDMCASGYCDDHGICRPALAGPGEPCNGNDTCLNGAACGYQFGGNRHPVCCESGKTTRYQGKEYCERPNGKDCANHYMCSSGYCDDDGACRPALAGPGNSCYDDDDCHNHKCALIYGGGSGSSVCCESGRATVFDTQKYCAGRPNGKACATSDMCASGNCDDHGICRPALTGPGEPCNDNDACLNGAACAYHFGGGSHPVCCESGETTRYQGKEHCERPNGKNCANNYMCSSGYCDDNGICRPALARPDEPCYDGDDCHNGKCALIYGDGSGSSVCCESGQTTVFDTVEYCTGRPNGKACATSDMCTSGYCDDNGICRPSLAGPGEPCSDNDACQNRACGIQYGGSPNPICCRTGQTTEYKGDRYCANRPNNRPCGSIHQICASQYCDADQGVCRPAVSGPSGSCRNSGDCASGASCGLIYGGGSGSSVCCESGKTTVFDTMEYCTGRPNGKACATSEMCASGYCDDNNICRPGLAGPGEPCNGNNACQNNACGIQYGGDPGSKICCKSGRTSVFDEKVYCTDLQDGSHCATHLFCKSEFCDRNGVCGPLDVLGGPGDSCNKDGDCKNNSCGHLPDSRGGRVCCFSGETKLVGGRVTCSGSPNGDHCSADNTCASGNCGDRGVCIPPTASDPCPDHDEPY